MKLTRMAWIYLGTGVLTLVLVILAWTRFQQIAEQNRLKDDLALVQKRLAGLELGELAIQKGQLQEQVSQANSELQNTSKTLNQSTNSITGDERLFALAQQCQVSIVNISASEKHPVKLNGISCTAFPIEAKVEGTVEGLTDFVIRLKSYLINGEIESVDVRTSEASNVPDTTTTETTVPATTTTETMAPASATIKLLIYNYEGA